jgi:hypothetical protein
LLIIISLPTRTTIPRRPARNVIASTEALFLMVVVNGVGPLRARGRRVRFKGYWWRKCCSSRWSRW